MLYLRLAIVQQPEPHISECVSASTPFAFALRPVAGRLKAPRECARASQFGSSPEWIHDQSRGGR